jgi:uncharacterized protein (DUF885 family)
MKALLLPSVASLLVVSCAPAEDEEPTEQIQAFFDRFTAEWIRHDPDLAISARWLEGEEQAALERQLTPRTREWKLDRIARARRGLAQLSRFDLEELSDDERLSAEIMGSQLQMLVDGEQYLDFEYPLQQMNGANVSLPNALTVSHPLRTSQDADSYVARLAQVGERLREAAVEAEYQAQLGVVPPRFIVQATIAQMRSFTEPPPAESPLVTTLTEKMQSVADLSAEDRSRLSAEAARIVEEQVYPAWREAIAVLERELPSAPSDAAVAQFPGGDEAYRYFLRRFTTTDLGPDEIHEIGLQEVGRIESEMDVLFRQVGLADGTIQERTERLRERLAYPNTQAGRRAIMADIDTLIAGAQVRSAALFTAVPETPVIAQPYPEFRWESAAASYTAPPPDGSRPGIFQMPLRPNELTRFALRSLVHHETVPGHHFQIALAVEDDDLPAFLRVRAFGGISASTEGWALYAERLAIEEGWYEGDVEGRIGALESLLFRARRLVVDTGLHTQGWTRQQAIDYGIVPSEVDRYVAWPGQACSYMIGQLRIVELRERARAALGARFSLRAFHDLVLGLGSVVPLDVLEGAVDRWIAAGGPGEVASPAA